MAIDNYYALSRAPEPHEPLLFVFHGTGGDEHQFFQFAADLIPGAGVISPRGDVSETGAARFFKRTAEGVYDMDDLYRATEKMSVFVQAWKEKFPSNPAYGFGYSNGANILASVMMARPHLFDRIGLLHPLIPWSPEAVPALAGRDVLITAGRSDAICPWPMTEQLVNWARGQGARVATEFHDGGHELREQEVLALAQFLKAKPAVQAA